MAVKHISNRSKICWRVQRSTIADCIAILEAVGVDQSEIAAVGIRVAGVGVAAAVGIGEGGRQLFAGARLGGRAGAGGRGGIRGGRAGAVPGRGRGGGGRDSGRRGLGRRRGRDGRNHRAGGCDHAGSRCRRGNGACVRHGDGRLLALNLRGLSLLDLGDDRLDGGNGGGVDRGGVADRRQFGLAL